MDKIGVKKMETVEAEKVSEPELRTDKKVKDIKPVANAKKAKKTALQIFKDSFIAEEIGDLREYIIRDLVVPMIKDAIVDGIGNSLSLILYGEKNDYRYRGSRYYSDTRSSSGIRRYDYSRGYSYKESRARDEDERRFAKAQQWEPLECESRQEALDILEQMSDILEEYGSVSIADMYDLGGVTTRPEDNNYGWRSLTSAHIRETRHRTYIIDMPRPICLK